MCDPGPYALGPSAWDPIFYHQYVQHHSRMTQWMQQFHQSIPTYPVQDSSNCHRCHNKEFTPPAATGLLSVKQPSSGCSRNLLPQCNCRSEQPISGGTRGRQAPMPGCASRNRSNDDNEPSMPKRTPNPFPNTQNFLFKPMFKARSYLYSGKSPYGEDPAKEMAYYEQFRRDPNSMIRTDVTYGPGRDYHIHPLTPRTNPKYAERRPHEHPTGGNANFDDEDEESTEDSGSGDEVVFDADAILSMRAARSQSDKDEEDSFELIDSLVDENFEYVELDAFGKMQRKFGRPPEFNAQKDLENEREMRRLLYGEKANTIAGLETAMSVTYDHLCDLHQPQLWPVLPINL